MRDGYALLVHKLLRLSVVSVLEVGAGLDELAEPKAGAPAIEFAQSLPNRIGTGLAQTPHLLANLFRLFQLPVDVAEPMQAREDASQLR